jgi:hypothetical protein
MVVLENSNGVVFERYEGNFSIDNLRAAKPIDQTLHVICTVSNPCNYSRRYVLAQEFIRRMSSEPNVALYVTEVIYPVLPNQQFRLTDPQNPRHSQLLGAMPLWSKENCINYTIQQKLPVEWKAVSWIDADVMFDNTLWVQETLQALSCADIVQLFAHCVDMDVSGSAMNVFQGSMYQYVRGLKRGLGIHYWHPGYAWACTRSAYQRMGGLYDASILGSGDDHLMRSLIGEESWITSVHGNSSDDYRETVCAFAKRCHGLCVGYVPGTIHHFFHGSKQKRKYRERWEILVQHQYQPSVHILKDAHGLNMMTPEFPLQMAVDILQYFLDRKEDDN